MLMLAAGGLLALVALGVGAVLLYNRTDEALTPASEALVAPRPVGGDATNNAYFMLLGMAAPAAADAAAVGRDWDQALFARYGGSGPPPEGPAPELPASPLDAAWRDSLRCNGFERDCLAHYRALGPELERFAVEYAFLVARYRRLVELPVYADRPPASILEPLPAFTDLLALDGFASAQAVAACEAGRCDQALRDVAASVAAWRRVLAATHGLVAKMVFTRALQEKLALVNALAQRYPDFLPAGAPLPAALGEPLTPAERGLDRPVASEVHMLARTLLNLDAASGQAAFSGRTAQPADLRSRLSDHMYRRHATVNMIAARLPYYPVESRWRQTTENRPVAPPVRWPSGSFWSDYLDNPTGKILLAIAAPEFGSYVDRLLDLDGWLRLTALHLQIRSGAVPDAAVPALLAAQAQRLGDPYTGQPMAWDPGNRTLWFQGRGNAPASPGKPGYRYTVRLGGGPAPRS